MTVSFVELRRFGHVVWSLRREKLLGRWLKAIENVIGRGDYDRPRPVRAILRVPACPLVALHERPKQKNSAAVLQCHSRLHARTGRCTRFNHCCCLRQSRHDDISSGESPCLWWLVRKELRYKTSCVLDAVSEAGV